MDVAAWLHGLGLERYEARLDFTVIGPAVNLVSRIENAAKMLGQRIVVSAELAATLDGVASLGHHQLRGLATPHELFVPV